MTRRKLIVAFVTGICLLPLAASAQNGPPGPGGGGPGGFGGFGGGGGGGFNLTDFMKQQLASNDDEWLVLQPKLMNVLKARFAVQGLPRFGGGRGPGGPGGGGGAGGPPGGFGGGGPGGAGGPLAGILPTGDDPVSVANNALQGALVDPNT